MSVGVEVLENGGSAELVHLLERVERKLDLFLKHKQKGRVEALDLGVLRSMTTKQHVALQMLVHGLSNAEIAKAMGVTTNTAKVHVRIIAAKLELHTRAQITKRMAPVLEAVDEEVYLRMSGGLPKDWAQRGLYGWDDDPEFAHLYT